MNDAALFSARGFHALPLALPTTCSYVGRAALRRRSHSCSSISSSMSSSPFASRSSISRMRLRHIRALSANRKSAPDSKTSCAGTQSSWVSASAADMTRAGRGRNAAPPTAHSRESLVEQKGRRTGESTT
eukprot:29739-Pelagococcus_subviridis.AAC.10